MKLKFEGEYSNGEKIGKGKEYYQNGKLRFEGEYLNGKKWNGKVYDSNGNLAFEIKDGNGKGKEYYSYGNLKFEGEYINGEKKGKIFSREGYLEFEGEYINGEKKGKEYNRLGKLRFEGEYLNGEKWNGKEYSFNMVGIKYEKEIINGIVCNVKVYDKDGNFDFEIKDRNGKGKLYNDYTGNLEYEGEFSDLIQNGQGKEYDDEGKLKFEGIFLNGKWKKG